MRGRGRNKTPANYGVSKGLYCLYGLRHCDITTHRSRAIKVPELGGLDGEQGRGGGLVMRAEWLRVA